MIRIADYIMEKVADVGVKHLYLVTGRGILYLSDAAAKCEKIECVPMHHEQACAYAAYAAADYSNQAGACLVSTGCAGTNALTGLLCAWQDDIPVIFISGQNTLKETTRYSGDSIRTWGQQEADIISVVSPLTKYAIMLTSAEESVYEIEKALYLASHGRKGPVWIDVPLDIQNMRIEPENVVHFVPDDVKTYQTEASEVAKLLNDAERPVILFGHGIREAGAEELLLNLIEKYQIPVVYSTSATDIISPAHSLCMGSVGMMGCMRSGAFTIQNADLLLVIGNRLSPMTTGPEYTKFAREAKVIVVDVDPHEHKKNTVQIDKLIHCDAKLFLQELFRQDICGNYTQWLEKCRHWKEVFPICEENRKHSESVDLYYLSEALSDNMPSNAVVVTDAGLEELILPANIFFSDKRRCIHPASQGAMGFALPAAIGAYQASRACTVAVIGDGSVMMNLQELATITYQKLPLKLIIINNDMYAVIRRRQKELFRTRTIGTDETNGVGKMDFQKLAECFGMQYMRIEQSTTLEEGLKRLFKTEIPILCEIIGLSDQNYTSCAYARNMQRHFVQRPLEDQSPFLERGFFLSEMIIPPIDQ